MCGAPATGDGDAGHTGLREREDIGGEQFVGHHDRARHLVGADRRPGVDTELGEDRAADLLDVGGPFLDVRVTAGEQVAGRLDALPPGSLGRESRTDALLGPVPKDRIGQHRLVRGGEVGVRSTGDGAAVQSRLDLGERGLQAPALGQRRRRGGGAGRRVRYAGGGARGPTATPGDAGTPCRMPGPSAGGAPWASAGRTPA